MKTIVITGATKGIGLSISKSFSNAGHHLIICARSENDLQVTKKELERTASKVHAFVVDVSKKDDLKNFVEEINQITPTIDVLVNNAGVFLPGSVHEENEDHRGDEGNQSTLPRPFRHPPKSSKDRHGQARRDQGSNQTHIKPDQKGYVVRMTTGKHSTFSQGLRHHGSALEVILGGTHCLWKVIRAPEAPSQPRMHADLFSCILPNQQPSD